MKTSLTRIALGMTLSAGLLGTTLAAAAPALADNDWHNGYQSSGTIIAIRTATGMTATIATSRIAIGSATAVSATTTARTATGAIIWATGIPTRASTFSFTSNEERVA